MHQYKALLQIFLLERIKGYRKGHNLTQENMAESLRISPRSYAYLEKGDNGCSATTLMFFFLILTEEELLQMLADFRALVEAEEYVAAG